MYRAIINALFLNLKIPPNIDIKCTKQNVVGILNFCSSCICNFISFLNIKSCLCYKKKQTSEQTKQTEIQGRINIKILKLFQTTEKKGMLSTYFTRSALPWYKTRKRWRKERKWNISTTSVLRSKNSQQNIGEPNLTIHDKDHTPWWTGIYSRDARVAPHSEVNRGNIPH